jgi:hypothetical protein
VAKVLIEVGMLKGAIRVLERLLLEDDTVSEVWFLLSATYRDTKRPATARQYLVTFLEVGAAPVHPWRFNSSRGLGGGGWRGGGGPFPCPQRKPTCHMEGP